MTEWVLPPDQLSPTTSRLAASCRTTPAGRASPVHARRLLAELQSPLPRSQRNVRPHDDGQPPPAARSSTPGMTASSSATRGKSFTAASATAPTGTARSAASTCRTCAMAAYQKLIAADNLLDREHGHTGAWVEAVSDDFNFDGRPEVQLVNDRLIGPDRAQRAAASSTSSTSARSATTCWPRSRAAPKPIIAACSPDPTAPAAA